MRRSTIVLVAVVLLSIAICGCNSAPGRPAADSEVLRPNDVLKFDALYQQNCAGCHGEQGKGGAAIALNSLVYLSIADDAAIRRITAQGVPGTAMPAFAQSSGGMLTDEQIIALVGALRLRSNKHDALNPAPPSYNALAPGDPQRGMNVYDTDCSSCHGTAGRGGSKARSILDSTSLNTGTDLQMTPGRIAAA